MTTSALPRCRRGSTDARSRQRPARGRQGDACTVDDAVAYARIVRRSHKDGDTRTAHPDAELVAALDDGTLTFTMFDPPLSDAPTLRVDTTDGYHPSFDAIVSFVNG